MITSCLGAPLDPEAQIHSPSHLDCLVGGHQIINKEDFKIEVKTFINGIRPLEIVTFPELNTEKLLGAMWKNSNDPVLEFPTNLSPSKISGGPFESKTVPEVIKNGSNYKYIAFIYGSNNRNYFDKNLPPKEGVKMLFRELTLVLQDSEFEAVFISTIFPSEVDVNEDGQLISNIKEFNDILLSPQSKYDEDLKIWIRSKIGEKRLMKWEVVDMTQNLPYNDISNELYFCEQNKTKMSKDKVHVNGKVLFKFYRKLDKTIKIYKKKTSQIQK